MRAGDRVVCLGTNANLYFFFFHRYSVHDGWGLSKEEKGNAIFHGDTTHMDAIRDKHNFVELEAHGLAVGLKEGLMGNSEVGHLNIGAGRIVWQDIVKIDQCEYSTSIF